MLDGSDLLSDIDNSILPDLAIKIRDSERLKNVEGIEDEFIKQFRKATSVEMMTSREAYVDFIDATERNQQADKDFDALQRERWWIPLGGQLQRDNVSWVKNATRFEHKFNTIENRRAAGEAIVRSSLGDLKENFKERFKNMKNLVEYFLDTETSNVNSRIKSAKAKQRQVIRQEGDMQKTSNRVYGEALRVQAAGDLMNARVIGGYMKLLDGALIRRC